MPEHYASTLAPTRPALRYPGGKWLLAPWILEYCPPHRCFVDVFTGAGSLLFRKPRVHTEILNDLNDDIILLFRTLRDPIQALELEQLLRLTPYSREEYVAAWEETAEPLERMRRMVIRSWQGFHPEAVLGMASGWRAGANRRGTMPSHDWATFPAQIARFTERLQGVLIEHCDALELLTHHDSPETLWFIDPPYDEAVTPSFRGYPYRVDHTNLYLALAQLQGMVIVCGYHSPTYDTLYWQWQCVEKHVNHGAEKGKIRKRTECLWLNEACQRGLRQLNLFAGGA